MEELGKINKKLEICINMFNSLGQEISDLLLREFPNDTSLYTYDSVIKEILKKNPAEPISLFILYIYKNDEYRQGFIDGDDTFFLENDHAKVLEGNQKHIKKILKFKSYWGKLDTDSKDFIKDVMKTLIDVCKIYIQNKDDGNKLIAKDLVKC